MVKDPPRCDSKGTRGNGLSSKATMEYNTKARCDRLSSACRCGRCLRRVARNTSGSARTLSPPRRHDHRCLQDTICDGGSGVLPRARGESERSIIQPGVGCCLEDETVTHRPHKIHHVWQAIVSASRMNRRANIGANVDAPHLLELPRATEKSSFFEEGCLMERLRLSA